MKRNFLRLIVFCSILLIGCLPSGQTGKGGYTITVYGFSIMKEALEKEIYPAFAAKWKREKGEDVHFASSKTFSCESPKI